MSKNDSIPSDSSLDFPGKAAQLFTEMLRLQSEAARQLLDTILPEMLSSLTDEDSLSEWSEATAKIQQMWLEFNRRQAVPLSPIPFFADPSEWMKLMKVWYDQFPVVDPARQQKLWEEGIVLWENILDQYGLGPHGSHATTLEPEFPRKDRRFTDPAWSEHPAFALLHQTYLLLAERVQEMVDDVDGIAPQERDQLRFATRCVLDAMSPANYPLVNPAVLERTIETRGANLVKGMERLAIDLEKGQLTHTDRSQFELGKNVAATPGKVVHETDLYQVIQYSPTTDKVLSTPLVIFPPWINRFYILDLNPKKSFVRWAVEQGLTVFMVSWRSADESHAEVGWDDYIQAQLDVIDLVRERLDVPSVHTAGYCVAGTTLAATLAVLAARGASDKVASATFFTAQVDFENAGDLKVFIDDAQLEMVRQASSKGYLDGRYMAATFNLLRGADLIWNYVVNHYLMGEDYPAFDLLFWNSDVTNLPAKWHEAYLRDLYRDNLLVKPDALSGANTPIDLTRIKTPCYIQAGIEDHIAPPQSVFRMTTHLSGPVRFVLAGSGHIAGVINPPSVNKYQYWTSSEPAATLDDFRKKATETAGSWWPDWIEWLTELAPETVPARGKRKPGGRGDKAIEDAPGRYVQMR
ncbi:PHA/PHB synthase family protein [Altericroceibacterium spongiae]|nr:class I poly(R)-hydroxyalkanoic acid synthase [Altericroceibacterium spongiae]